jgi:hypothetical protein
MFMPSIMSGLVVVVVVLLVGVASKVPVLDIKDDTGAVVDVPVAPVVVLVALVVAAAVLEVVPAPVDGVRLVLLLPGASRSIPTDTFGV